MNQYKALAASILLATISACSGGGSSGITSDPQTQAYDLAEEQTALQDTYEIPVGEDVVAHVSSDGLSEYASSFELSQSTNINQISFSGIVNADLESLLSLVTFIVTIYSPNEVNENVPENSAATELILQANATFIKTLSENNHLYGFNIEQANLYNLEAGEYFISIMDNGSEGIEFQWARENSDHLTTGLAGGASRETPQSPWKSEQWGRNLRIAGSCQSTCIVSGQTKGSISINQSDYQLSAAIIDAETTGPVYFLGLYESTVLAQGGASGEETVTINEQDSENVTLVLSSYNATNWILTGDGVDNLSSVYILDYQTGAVTGAAQSTPVTSYSFDEGNYIGTLSEWPDLESTELSEQEKQQALIAVEAITGSVTSYGVVYSVDGFEVY